MSKNHIVRHTVKIAVKHVKHISETLFYLSFFLQSAQVDSGQNRITKTLIDVIVTGFA